MVEEKYKASIFKELLDNEELVNLKLTTEDGGQFKVHLDILIANSIYVRKLLEADEGQGDNVEREISISGISKQILKNIIDCTYTGKLTIQDDNVKGLIDAAEQLGVADAIQLCNSYLGVNVTVENCLSRFWLANIYAYIELKQSLKKFIEANFEKVRNKDEFCNLSAGDLKSMLSSDSLNVRNEESVYTTVMKWAEKDLKTRTFHLPSLLLCVRIGFCDSAFFSEQICYNPLITGNVECHGFLYQGSQLFADLQQANSESGSTFEPNHPFLRPRIPHEIIFVMGGWSSGSSTGAMETYDFKTKRWFLTNADNFPRAYHGMVWHAGKIYVIGGFDGQQCFNSVRSYDPLTKAWDECGCMHVQRCYVSCAAVDDYVYAMGGFDGHRRNRSCERYEPSINQWSFIADMNAVRSDASADTLNGRIYIAGGFNGTQVLDSAEVYDPEINQWTVISNMNIQRSGVKMVSFRNNIYVIGGFNGSNRLATVERYEESTRRWRFVSSMLGPRSNFATVVVNDSIYVIGGFNGLSTIASVEMYNPSANVWTAVQDLNLNRSALAACTVLNIDTAQDYTFLGNYM